jgi:hypothetical protein
MKIINVSKTPYEFTFDGSNFNPIQPGEVQDFPDDIGAHAIRKSVVLDDEGNVETYRMAALSSVQKNPDWLRSVATYPCPFAATGQCQEQPFRDIEALKTHLDFHFLGKKAPK